MQFNRFKDQKVDYWSSSPSLHPSRLLYICHSLVVNDGRKEGVKERETRKIDREQENVTEQEVTEGGKQVKTGRKIHKSGRQQIYSERLQKEKEYKDKKRKVQRQTRPKVKLKRM